MGNESRVTCMKNYAWWLCHKYDVNYMIMQWQYDKSKVCHDDDERNGGKLHGNISRNGYGNAIIGRYGGCFEEDIRRFMCDRAYRITGFGCTGEVCTNSQGEKGQCTVPKRLENLRKGNCAYNPWTHISHKELIYLLQKFISPRSKVLLHMPLEG